MKKHALVALGMGGPDSIEAIKPFLYNLFSDRDIINFHIGKYPQKLLASIISARRTPKLTPKYLEMDFNGASPQNIYTYRVLDKVKHLYEKCVDANLDIYGGMCYYHPFIKDTLNILKNTYYNKVIFFPMYPHFSTTTTGACISKIKSEITMYNYIKTNILEFIPYWYTNIKYNECITNRILEAAKKINKNIEKCYILFSAHSIPLSTVNKGDPYIEQIHSHVENIVKKLNIKKYEISYQSKVGPIKWMTPSTEETLHKLKILRTDNIIVVPISFVNDHIETLIELDKELIPLVSSVKLNIVRSESLNDSDDFAEAINDIILGGNNEKF